MGEKQRDNDNERREKKKTPEIGPFELAALAVSILATRSGSPGRRQRSLGFNPADSTV